MINIELNGRVIKVAHSNIEFNLTDENGQVEINSIIRFMNDTSVDLLKGEITYKSSENDQIDKGLELFITTLFNKLCEEKTKDLTNISS